MEFEFIEAVLGLGVGGVGMVIIFLCYRADRKGHEKRLTQLLKKDQQSREENTEALVNLAGSMDKLNNGHLHVIEGLGKIIDALNTRRKRS